MRMAALGKTAGQAATRAGPVVLVASVHDRPAGRLQRDWVECELLQAWASSRLYDIDDGGFYNLPRLRRFSAEARNSKAIGRDLHDERVRRRHKASVEASISTAQSAAQGFRTAASFANEPLQTGSILPIQVSRELGVPPQCSLHAQLEPT